MFDIKLLIPLALLIVSSYMSQSGCNVNYSGNSCGEPYEECEETYPMGLSLCQSENSKERRLMSMICHLKADEPNRETVETCNTRSSFARLRDTLWTLLIKIISTITSVFMAIIYGIGEFCICIVKTLYCIVYILLSVVKGVTLSIWWIVTKGLYAIWYPIDFVLRPIINTIWCVVKSMFNLASTFWRTLVGEVTCPIQFNTQLQNLSPEKESCNENVYAIKMQKHAKKMWNDKEEAICTMGFGCGSSRGHVCPSDCIEVIKDCLCGLIQSLCKCMWDFFLGILSALSNLLVWKDPPRSFFCVVYEFFEDIYNLFYNLFTSLAKAFKNAWKALQNYYKKQNCKRRDSALRKFMKSICLKLKRCVDNVYHFLKKMAPCDPYRRSYSCYD